MTHSIDQAFEEAARFLRQADHERYLACLFAPEEKRHHLFALHAFAADIATIRSKVSEPMPGEIRLQWWHDAIEGKGRGEVESNPLAAALNATVVQHDLPIVALKNMIEARIFDLYDDPFPTLNDLKGHAAEAEGAVFQLACLILQDEKKTNTADASGHASVAHYLTRLLRSLSYHIARGHFWLPLDSMEENSVKSSNFHKPASENVKKMLAQLQNCASENMQDFEKTKKNLDATLAPAFATMAFVGPWLKKIKAQKTDPLTTQLTMPAWRKPLIIWNYMRKW
jgi:phytoene synthase